MGVGALMVRADRYGAGVEKAGVRHTPGPWAFSFESVDPEWAVVTTPGGAIVANVNADHRQQANARLIAAAPDMLAAMKQASEILRGRGYPGWGIAKDILNEAIAKATLTPTGGTDTAERQCDRCHGNGEIVTDWGRYKHPHEGDKGDEAVAECPECGGSGLVCGDMTVFVPTPTGGSHD